MTTAGPAAVRRPRRAAAQAAAQHVVAADAAFASVVAASGPFLPRPPADDPFNGLARAICFQQLAGKAAASIHGRFLALFDDLPPAPRAVLAAGPDALRSCGLSGAKTAAILDLAGKCSDGTVPLEHLTHVGDDEVVARLSSVRGIGRWTAEMFLLFDLRRPDVWPVDDYGVRKGWSLLHGLGELPAPKVLQALGDPLRPYRSAAAWYCWRAVDTLTP